MIKKNILILMSKTGSGHETSAQALKAGFDQLFPNTFSIEIIDLLTDYLPWPVSKAPESYDFLSIKTPWLWRLLYEVTDEASSALDLAAARAFSRNFERAFRDYKPDLIISVHPLFQHVSLYALSKLKMSVPFITVVTDLVTQHPMWFHTGVALCFVPNKKTFLTAQGYGLSEEQLSVVGLPIRPSFMHLPQKGIKLKTKLGLEPTLPAVIIYAVREKPNLVTSFINQVADSLNKTKNPLGQMVVLCGKDENLKKYIENQDWPVPLKTVGFVDNMNEWMAACDCIVTKAGPGVIAESIACGLPMIINSFIPGQETENIPYVIDNSIGVYTKDPAEVAATVSKWFSEDEKLLQEMSANAKRLAKPDATLQIVKEIGHYFDLGNSR